MAPLAHLLAPSSAPAALGWTVSVSLATGLCLLFLARAGWRWAGLVTAEHRAFSPPLAVAVTVRVGPGRAPLSSAGTCTG
jgi:hypothetical protein